MSSQILIKPITAKLYHETQTYTKMDPYVKIIFNKNSKKSKIAKNQHLTPNWNEEFIFEKNSHNPLLFLELWDHNTILKDSLIGTGCINISSLSRENNLKWIPLVYKGDDIGSILVEFDTSCF